tara:strand:- start:307 stop:591 length:285 start_codon:yes stop_codon:yes gene_type:complete
LIETKGFREAIDEDKLIVVNCSLQIYASHFLEDGIVMKVRLLRSNHHHFDLCSKVELKEAVIHPFSSASIAVFNDDLGVLFLLWIQIETWDDAS